MSIHDAAIFNSEAGGFISSKMERLGEILKDYDPYLELRWIPPANRTAADSLPYCVVDTRLSGAQSVVFYFAESEPPEKVFAKIILGDSKHGDILQRIEVEEQAAKAFRLKEQLEERMEMHDQFHFLATSRSNNIVNWGKDSNGKKIRLDSNRRRI